MTRIFIERLELDIDAGLSNQITYAIDDLYNLDSKQTSFSKTIILPGTTNNNALFGNIFEMNNSNSTVDGIANVRYNFNASRTAKCLIEVNGLQIIKGVLRLLEIVYNGDAVEYECAVFGELGGFVSALGNKRLEDINLSVYDHTFSNANIVASWDNANTGTGYYYPLVDIGAVSTGTYGTAKLDYQYRAFRPAFHVREYLDKIITESGYTFEGAILDTDFFKRLIIEYNSKALTKISSVGLDVSYSGGGQSLSDPSTFLGIQLPTHTSLGSFTTGDNITYTFGGAAQVNGIFYARFVGTIYYIQNDLSAFNCGMGLSVVHGGVPNSTGHYFSDTGLGTIAFDVTIQVTSAMDAGDTVSMFLFGNDSGAIPDTYTIDVTSASLIYTLNSLQPVQINLGETIAANDVIPRGIFQKDFFASILKMFNLLVTEDKFKNKHLVITPWVDFFDTSVASYEDWSDKIDLSKQIRSKPMSEVNARYYEFKYKTDNDFYNEDYRKKYNEGYGDRIYDNGFDFAKDKDTTEVIFAGTALVGYAGEDKVVSTTFKKNNDVEEAMDHVVRIMQAKKIIGVTSWKIMDGASTVSTNTNYGYAGHLDDPDAPAADIGFGVPKQLYFTLATGDLSANLFNAYYSPYMAEITDKDSRLLTCMVKLTEEDIYNLDFSKFKFINGGLYRLMKVIDYTAGENEMTKCELLRVIYTTY